MPSSSSSSNHATVARTPVLRARNPRPPPAVFAHTVVVSRSVPLLLLLLLLLLLFSLSVSDCLSLFLRCPFPFRVSLSVCLSPFSSACCNPFCETSCARTRRRGKSERAVDRELRERERERQVKFAREYRASSPSTGATGITLDNDDDNDDADDDDDEDHSLATPETNYRWDTSDCDLEHSRFALDGVKHAGPITFHRSFSLSAPCRSRSKLNDLAFFRPLVHSDDGKLAETPPHAPIHLRERERANEIPRASVFREAAD